MLAFLISFPVAFYLFDLFLSDEMINQDAFDGGSHRKIKQGLSNHRNERSALDISVDITPFQVCPVSIV